ncbi:unnamed protein product [Psylliodes chrysocephalus]|uniref:Uncharacterized protein n=1 Tax=Psylliodes chrysocephalus TaxID=3402493 RepID=A0A9P0CVN5_9CUCU|nr:unnamed protein product [Psylliodes chrysocephala]
MQTGIKEPLKELKLESKPIMTMTQPKLPEKKEEIKPVKEDEKSVEKSLKHFMSENFKPFKQDIKEMKEKTEEKPEKKSEQNISKDSKNHDKEDESKEDEKHHHQHHDKNAYYKFEYSVNDKKTKDVKHQKEELHGDKIVGEYSLLEEDGNVRTVKYTADWKNGFRAQIHNSKKM